MIIFYDVASKTPGLAWAPNPWKTRFTLNYKGIPYTTEWVEFPDIEAKCKETGIPPGEVKADGTPIYILPAIWDPSTKTGVANSLRIAEYLDKTYPDTPRVCFDGLDEYNHIMTSFKTLPELKPIPRFTLPLVYERIINPASQGYFRRTREAAFGRKVEELVLTGKEREEAWNQVRQGFNIVDGWLQKNGGPYARGDQISIVDFVWGGPLMWCKILWGENSELWQDVLTWNDGRWKAYMENLEKYAEPVQMVN
ncbi:hypothetical protein APHAL10511_003033 [Amanita phalloides]|nr:hypothetical protein APHAL10511_003033 [Amanita phalloides]